MNENKFKEVTHAEFDEFIENYTNPITWDKCLLFDPPMILANDFYLYQDWDAVIAYIVKNSLQPIEPDCVNDEYYILNETK